MENLKNKKIPILNDTFDPNALFYTLKNNILLFFILLFVFIGGSYTYLRYTPLTYKSISILQINEEETNTSTLLNIDNVYGKVSTANLIEQLRSTEFLKRILKKLPLNITYFNEGTFKKEEMYKKSPFFVEVRNQTTTLNNVPIYISFLNESEYEIEYEIQEKQYKYKYSTNSWNKISVSTEIYVNISNYYSIKEHNKNLKKNRFQFKILDDNTALNYHMKHLQISLLNQRANTIQIEYKGENPQKTSEIVNAISEEFIDFNVEKKQSKAERILVFIEQQLKIVYQELNETEKKIRHFKKKYKIQDNLFQQPHMKNISSELSQQELLDELEKLDAEFSNFGKLTQKLQSTEDINTAELVSLLSDSRSESMILNFLNAIQQLQNEKSELLINVTEHNRRIKAIDSQITSQKKLLADFLKISNDNLMKEKELLRQRLLSVNTDSLNTPNFDELEYAKLMRLYNVHEEFYNELLSKKAQYLISKAGNVSQNLILEKSQVPKTPISPIKTKIIIITLLLYFLLVLSIIAIKYILHNEITSVSDVTKYTDVPVTGVIPLSRRAKGNDRFIVENKPNSIFTESFRILRSNLEFISNEKGPKIITITSTISGEGKTFVAINLGGVFAFSGKKVVLLDMDLRRPKVHISFNADNEIGMSTLLINRDKIEDSIKPTGLENFDFIPAGPIPPNPSELANSAKFDEILETLKKTYDIIIIDTPPIGIVSDAIYSYIKSDYPLYVTKANYSKRSFIYNMSHLKDQKNIKNISIIINGIELQINKYGYSNYTYGYDGYYGYGYGYGYGYYTNDNDLKKGTPLKSFINKIFNKGK